ncbi:MAG: 4'-phosphopantetheinyl transferase superfamily protein [Deltaproteobacteria bacterium]|nr:4'-phosphopantetheinyl transferase superfamily protein [Deltaproteobacteria bacterium]
MSDSLKVEVLAPAPAFNGDQTGPGPFSDILDLTGTEDLFETSLKQRLLSPAGQISPSAAANLAAFWALKAAQSPPIIFLVSLSTLSALGFPPEKLIAATLNWLPPYRQAKITALRQLPDQARSATAGLLMLTVLGVTSDRQVVFGPHGAPALTRGECHFSLSHSGDWVALSVWGCLCGVDVETVRQKPVSESLAARVLTEEEMTYFNQWGCDPMLFSALWTRKESLVKAIGRGIDLIERCPVLPLAPSIRRRWGRLWRLWSLSLPGAVLSLASEAFETGELSDYQSIAEAKSSPNSCASSQSGPGSSGSGRRSSPLSFAAISAQPQLKRFEPFLAAFLSDQKK